jgi:hypothetical protein
MFDQLTQLAKQCGIDAVVKNDAILNKNEVAM